jgi:hypothetical protein
MGRPSEVTVESVIVVVHKFFGRRLRGFAGPLHCPRPTAHGPLFTQLSFTFIPLVHRFSEYEVLRARLTWGGSFRSFLRCVHEEVLLTGYETGHTDQLELRTQIWLYLIRDATKVREGMVLVQSQAIRSLKCCRPKVRST